MSSIEVSVKNEENQLDRETFLLCNDVSELFKAIILWLCNKACPSCGVTADDVERKRDEAQKSSCAGSYHIEQIKGVVLDLTIDEDSRIINIGKNAEQKVVKSATNILKDVYNAILRSKANDGSYVTSTWDGDNFKAAFMPTADAVTRKCPC